MHTTSVMSRERGGARFRGEDREAASFGGEDCGHLHLRGIPR